MSTQKSELFTFYSLAYSTSEFVYVCECCLLSKFIVQQSSSRTQTNNCLHCKLCASIYYDYYYSRRRKWYEEIEEQSSANEWHAHTRSKLYTSNNQFPKHFITTLIMANANERYLWGRERGERGEKERAYARLVCSAAPYLSQRYHFLPIYLNIAVPFSDKNLNNFHYINTHAHAYPATAHYFDNGGRGSDSKRWQCVILCGFNYNHHNACTRTHYRRMKWRRKTHFYTIVRSVSYKYEEETTN